MIQQQIFGYLIIEEFLKSLNIILFEYSNLIIIGIIDCIMTDKLKIIIDKLDKRIKIIILNENNGISYAINIGVEYLLNNDCDYIFISDDDIILK